MRRRHPYLAVRSEGGDRGDPAPRRQGGAAARAGQGGRGDARQPWALRQVVVLRVSKTDPCGGGGGARVTKVKLIEPQDALLLGQVYRLVTLQGACHPSFRGSLFLVARFLRSGGEAS